MAKAKTTVYEIADACGVSISTVSRVINGFRHVSPDKRRRVIAQMQRMGYQPSAAARALSTGRSRVISVWIGNLNSRYVMLFLGQLEQHLADVDYEMLLRNLWHRPLDQPLPAVSADGIIVVDETWWISRLRDAHMLERVPVVSMGARWVDWVDHVALDLSEGVQQAVAHLLETGCRRIAFVAPHVRDTSEDTRHTVYRRYIREAGREPEVIATPWISDRIRAEEAMDRYLSQGNRPDGLLCYNDDHAIAVCRTLRKHGLRIPDDVAVIGINGLPETEYLNPPLSTVVLPVAEACAAAWSLLENRMATPDLPVQSVVLKPQLEVRASSKREQPVPRPARAIFSDLHRPF